MPITVAHILTATTPDNTSYEIRPSHWNSAHAITFSPHATDVEIYRINNSGTLNNLIKDAFSTGWIEGGGISDAGSGNINIAAGEGFIRSSNSPVAILYYADWNALNGQSVPSNTTRYIVVYYNAGSPVVQLLSSAPSNNHEYIYLGEVHNIGGTLQIHTDPRPAGDALRRLQDWAIGVVGTRVVSGEVVSDPSSPSRKLKITAGEFWDAHFLSYTDSTIDTSGAGTFTTYYRNGSGDWTRTSGQTDWPNTQYDDGTGTLATMADFYFANLWVIRNFLGNLIVQYGQAQYSTADDAYAEIPPARAEEQEEHGFWAAQITFQKGDTSPNRIKDKRPIIGAEVTGSPGADDGGNVIVAGTQTANSVGSVVFSNSNGISFGMSNSSVVTASHNGLTTAAASNHSHGNPALALTNLSGTTASNSGGFTLSLSVGAGGAGDGVNILAAGTQTANTTGTVVFSNSNNVTFGMNNSSIVTASASFAGGGDGYNIVAAGTQTAGTTGTVIFSNSNGVSFGLNASTVTASHNGITQQSTQPVAASGSNGSFTFNTLSFGALNGMTLYTSNGSIVGSYTDAGGGGGAQTVSAWMNISNIITTHLGAAITNASLSKRPWFFPIQCPYQINGLNTIEFWASRPAGTSLNMTYGFAFYTLVNSTSMALLSSTTNAVSLTASDQFSGMRVYRFTGLSAMSLTPGLYRAALYFSGSNNSTAVANLALAGMQSILPIAGSVFEGTNSTGATNATNHVFPLWGVYSNTTAGFPANVARNQITGMGNATVNNIPFMIFRNI